ncbi:hypothetical protein FOL47_004699 [Perkinsus chesapeaki]|uniref:EF-hand domain-containing protein n=1 Tax=Perkinsus chesapeaki TaxID=330153 RepID=A0A7J6M111_PERCH|nr:hypothetical protein FOL47_004699 [Perkinsus chesapeaki]
MAQSAHMEVKLDTLRGKEYASRNANDYCAHATDGSSLKMHGDRPLMDWQLTLRQTRRPLGQFSSPKGPPGLVGSRKRARSVPEKDLHVDGVYADCKYGNIADSGSMVRSVSANSFIEKDSVHWQVNLRSKHAPSKEFPKWQRYHQRAAASFDRIKENMSRDDPRSRMQETTLIDRVPDRRVGGLLIRHIREDLPYDSLRYPGCEGTVLQNWRHLIHPGKTRTLLRHETTLRGFPDNRSNECVSEFIGKKRWHFANTLDHITEIDSKLKYLSTHQIQSEPRDYALSKTNRLGGPIMINGDEPIIFVKVSVHERELESVGVPKSSAKVCLSLEAGGLDDAPHRKIFRPRPASRREALFMHLEEPSLTNTSYYVHIAYSTIILFSVITAVVITLPVPEQLSPRAYDVLHVAENVFNAAFITELLLRLSTAPSLIPALMEPYNWLDLFIVAPYVALWCGVDRHDYKGLRLALFVVPAMRMVKITRNSSGWRLLVTSLSLSLDALRVPMLMLFFLVVWFASILYWIETDLNNTGVKTFHSLPHAMWFSLVTISTVGYGDIELATPAGSMMTATLIIIGVSYMAMPLSIIGSTFWDVWTDRDRILIVDKIHQRLSNRQITRDQVYNVFTQIDADGSGGIDIGELEHMLNDEFRLAMPKRNVKKLFKHMDPDSSGKVSFEEFCSCLFPDLAAHGMPRLSRATMKGPQTRRGSIEGGSEGGIGQRRGSRQSSKRSTLAARMGQNILETIWGRYEGDDDSDEDDDSYRSAGGGREPQRSEAVVGETNALEEKLTEMLEVLRRMEEKQMELPRATKLDCECQTDGSGCGEFGTQTRKTYLGRGKTGGGESKSPERPRPRVSFARGYRDGLTDDNKEPSGEVERTARRSRRKSEEEEEAPIRPYSGTPLQQQQWNSTALATGVVGRLLAAQKSSAAASRRQQQQENSRLARSISGGDAFADYTEDSV